MERDRRLSGVNEYHRSKIYIRKRSGEGITGLESNIDKTNDDGSEKVGTQRASCLMSPGNLQATGDRADPSTKEKTCKVHSDRSAEGLLGVDKLMIMGVGDEDAVIKEKAQILIEDVIRDAKEHLRDLQEKEREAEYIIQNIQWTSCKDFTVERGQQQIEEYMSTWEFHGSWLHWSDYLQEQELTYSKRYHYRVRWSIPTCRKPIPRTTACIYFIIEISKIKPPVRIQSVTQPSHFPL
ncbi:A-kinase anchor protein 14 [Chelonia mydas]|uniref:A-kinase anchor protein 14 n=1 Tax=Chelonia mydas TaxID=8469 RepID=M7BE03_CHEMY|nr:A-kinase anchor protein 14 [Chelonia mydas]